MNLNTLLEGRRTLTRATILSHLHVDWKTHVERAVLSLKMPHGSMSVLIVRRAFAHLVQSNLKIALKYATLARDFAPPTSTGEN